MAKKDDAILTQEEAPAYNGDELVEYTLPRRGPDDMSLFVGVNGQTIRIQRGVPVKIKRKFVEVIENAERQEEASYRAMQNAQNASKRALADL